MTGGKNTPVHFPFPQAAMFFSKVSFSGQQDGIVLFAPGKVGTQVIWFGNGNIEEFLKSGNDTGEREAFAAFVRNQPAVIQRGDQFHQVDQRTFPMER